MPDGRDFRRYDVATLSLQPESLGSWVADTIQSKLTKIGGEAERAAGSFTKTFDTLIEAATELEAKSEREMQLKRGDKSAYKSAKALNHLTNDILERLAQVARPEQVDYSTLAMLHEQVERVHRDLHESKNKWASDVRPFYILDMMSLGSNIDKLKRLQTELGNFLKGPGKQLHELDQIEQRARELGEIDTNYDRLDSDIKRLLTEIAETDRQIAEIETQRNEITASPEMRTVAGVHEQLQDLRERIIDSGFRRLGRPLRKLQSESSRGVVSVEPELREVLAAYLNAPSRTLIDEEEGYPKLRRLFDALVRAVEQGKVSVKKREQRKIMDRYRAVVQQNVLLAFQSRGKTLRQQLESLTQDPTVAESARKLTDFRKELQLKRKEGARLKKELDIKRREQAEAKLRALSLKRALEEQVKGLTGKKVELSLTVTA